MNDEREDAVAQLVRAAGARPKPDPERAARVRAAVHDEWQQATQRKRWMRYGIAAAAAAIAAVLLFIPRAPKGRVIDTPVGTVASIDWNGATLRVDGGSRVRIESNTVATLERGSIFFSSARHAGVTIHTRFGAIRDIGTQFEVRLREDALHVRVREGIVDVRGTRVTAGMELVATRDTITQNPIERVALRITLEGRTLGDVIEQAAREKGLRVEWHVKRDVVLHGTVPLTPDEAIDAATAATGATTRIEGDTLIIGAGR